MQDADIELLLDRKMPHAGDKRLPERPVIRPFGKDFVDRRIVEGRLPSGVCGDGQTLPLHARIQDPQDEVKDPMIAQFALRPTPGHREVREDKRGELRFGELNRNWRRSRLLRRRAH